MALSVNAEYIVLSKTEDEEILYLMFETEDIPDLVGVQTLNSHGSYILFKPSGEGFDLRDCKIRKLCQICDQKRADKWIANVLHEAQQYHLRDNSYICESCQKNCSSRVKDFVGQFSDKIATELL